MLRIGTTFAALYVTVDEKHERAAAAVTKAIGFEHLADRVYILDFTLRTFEDRFEALTAGA